MKFDPRNILVIDFGQLGDVVLSMPALSAIRQKFPRARVTVAVGRAAGALVELAGVADETLAVDRVALRDGPKALSVFRIGQLALDVRRRRFDFVIDLHSLSEQTCLTSSQERGRGLRAQADALLDYLSNFRPRRPRRQHKNAIDRYLDVLAPLGIGEVSRTPRLPVREEDSRAVEELLKKAKAGVDAPLVGIFPGAGHPSRCWPLERFAELAWMLVRNDSVRVVLFAGPEERPKVREMRAALPPSTVVFDRLTIPQVAAASARLSAFVSNDTGPMHIAAAVGTPVVILMAHHPMFDCYIPPGDRHRVVSGRAITDISVGQAYEAARAALVTERMASLFSD